MSFWNKKSSPLQPQTVRGDRGELKRKFGETLNSKNQVAQVNKLLAKIVAYNLTVVIHEMYENGINPEFLGNRGKLI